MKGLLSRHLNNTGRHNLSVADSSYDTWLDGYRPGVKGRKGSIYVEGAVCAFICDVRIMTETDNKSSLSTAMRILWERFGKSKKGLTADEYWSVLSEVAGTSLDDLRKKYADGTCDTWEDLVFSMKANGIELTRTVNEKGITTPILTPLP
jgi:predicted metalloprotease with PDZ domain